MKIRAILGRVADDPLFRKGDLTPRPDVRMVRVAASAELAPVMRQWWQPSWDLPDGEVRAQHVLGYPVANLVAEDGAALLYGPTTTHGVRELRGTGWALGALLTPAAGRHLATRPFAALVDAWEPVAVEGAVDRPDTAREALTEALRRVLERLDDDDLAANALLETVEGDPTLLRVADLAERMHRSVRSLDRLARRSFGLPPAAIIRRRRLQDAAEAVRLAPDRPLRDIAAEFGFADHAHLTREFSSVLGFTPSEYRAGP